VRYVSTRGEAPPLGFIEVMLAGLARDGGLYVPESWPTLDGKTIAGFAGRPYAEVAVDVVRLGGVDRPRLSIVESTVGPRASARAGAGRVGVVAGPVEPGRR